MMKNEDSLWKSRLQITFTNFLHSYYPSLAETIDFRKKFEWLDQELEQVSLADNGPSVPPQVNKLVKVFNENGEEQWILIHLALQGSDDKDVAERLFTYYYRIFTTYHKPITVFTLSPDDNPSARLHENPALSVFNTLKLCNQYKEHLLKIDNPVAMLVAAFQALPENGVRKSISPAPPNGLVLHKIQQKVNLMINVGRAFSVRYTNPF
ncbi:hypothetical protein DYBT9275_06124 [Dyadobacter sp. CECT 9275]|uniref:Uncharacterized protein n=1 Tax=Dyadobacter helix TaxID=2822344 RepID=A0A916JHH6_9BACT|nr:hypothetical protein [Dyadobacter sp. CECT 9275]CAG5018998.1 hypothetical protein DYBT9275_06124 [Dyadobacter sp. CECT 9275]